VSLSAINSNGLVPAGSHGWRADDFWAGGSSSWGANPVSVSHGVLNPMNSSYYGFKLYCYASSCSNSGWLAVPEVDLTATENQGPGLLALGSDNLWNRAGQYVWNAPGDPFSVALAGSDSTGVCSMGAKIRNTQLSGPPQAKITTQWQQCPNWTWTAAQGATVHTQTFVPDSGPLSLTLYGINAAGVVTQQSQTVQVDNTPVQLNLSGPSTASTAAGPQHIAATASAGPSGALIGCTVDGGAEQWQLGSARQIAVAGAGLHNITCRAHNGALDPHDQYAYSPTKSWSLDIGQPTVNLIGFSHVVDRLRCHGAVERVRVPAHTVTVRRHRHLVRVRVRARSRLRRVELCHPQMGWRTETTWVTVHRHGRRVRVKRTRRVRVALFPHTVLRTRKHLPHGAGTKLSGWLGTTGSIAAAGQTVQIIAAADNGTGRFTQLATATTHANGNWTAHIPAGPSRLIRAVYPGSPTLLSATSRTVRTIVPASVRIRITPKLAPWGSVIRITGQVIGGYVPTNSKLLRLNVGIGRIGQLVGLPNIHPDGRFVICWRFNAGHGLLHPWFSLATLPEAAFAYAPGVSKRVYVTLG
jgi:hypothetical protein